MFPTAKLVVNSETSKNFDFSNQLQEYNKLNWISSLQDSDYSKIQEICLQFNQNNISASSAELGKDLEKFQNLKFLDLSLSQNKICDQSFIDICSSISKIKSLDIVYLAFWGNQITEEGIKKAIEFIVQCQNLKIFCLYLGDNQIKDAGLQIISENLKHLQNIKHLQLSLWKNYITDVGFRYFSENLSSFPNIISLYIDFLYHQNITDETAILLGKSLSNLKHMRVLHINFDQTGITEVGKQKLAEMISQISQIVCLKYFYFEKNGFLNKFENTKQTLKSFKRRSHRLIFVQVNLKKNLIEY
ncbi:hypothetical protein ABPG74_002053 [Tetrahymena malaccensis]